MKTFDKTEKYIQDDDIHHFEIKTIIGKQFKYTTQFILTSDCKNLISLLIGQALMLPRETEFSVYDLLDIVGDEVYGDIYDDEIFAVDTLLEMYFEEHFMLYELQQQEGTSKKLKIFKR